MQNSVLKYLEDTVQRHPEKIAVVDNSSSITFKELCDESRRIGTGIFNKLRKHNCPILVYLPKSVNCINAIVGVLYSRNFYTTTDVKFPWEKVDSIIKALMPELIITDTLHYDSLLANGVNPDMILNIDGIDVELDDTLIDINKIIDTDIVYVLFTSGSTGTPKGVIISNRSIIDYIDWAKEVFEIDDKCVIGNQAPFYFDNSTLDIYTMLCTGATLHIIPETFFAFPAKLMSCIAEKKINFIFWVPSIMINVANFDVLSKVNANCLKKILFAGEVMPNKCLNYWRANIKEAVYANLYGPTEITVGCTYYIVNRDFVDEEPLPIGIPCKNTEIMLLDAEKKLITDINKTGELCVRGSSLAFGYWGNEKKTKDAFIQNPLNNMYYETIYCTGDLAHYNEFGEIMFDGRRDSQIKHLGYRIELGEIETAASSVDELSGQCVLYDNKKKEIVMFYVSKVEIDKKIIRKKLGDIIPKYMIPTKYIELSDMPYNGNGKIDRARLRSEYID